MSTNALPSTCYALHGFMGRPQDWDMLSSCEMGVDAILKVNIFKIAAPRENIGLLEWGRSLNALVQQQDERRVLMGYSLGGRLAVHALLEDPFLWDSAILVSTHLGLKNSAEREKRLAEDFVWAQRFEEEPWESLIASWNAREIFSAKKSPFIRQESHYSRFELANVLRYWSLGCQEDLTLLIAQLPMPILWMVGGDDNAYRQRAKTLKFRHPKSQVLIVPDAGHRVPWECSDYQQQINFFLQPLCDLR